MKNSIIPLEDGTLQLKVIDETGNIIRSSYTPNTAIETISNEEVRAKAEELWTTDVIESYLNKIQSFYQ